MGTLAKSVDSDEMQHNAAFHQSRHCLLRLKQPSWTEILHNLENCNLLPIKEQTGKSHIYLSKRTCIDLYGEIHQNTKG